MYRNISSVIVVLVTLIVIGCSNSDGETAPQSSPNPATVGAADLSGLNATETEAEIIHLMREGYSMYTRTFVFPGKRIPGLPCLQTAQIVCDTYPEKFVDELWVSTDSEGSIENFLGRRSTEDGSVLATAVFGVWTDLATGEQWMTGDFRGRDQFGSIQDRFTKIGRELGRNLEVVDGEILGRPSKVFLEGEFEYQVANPFIERTTRWQDDANGNPEMISELRVIDFAMLPPGKLPDFAVDTG